MAPPTDRPPGWTFQARQIYGADVDPDNLTPQQREQVETNLRLWLKANADKATRVRRLKRAQRLRETAAAIEAEYADGAS